VLELVNKATTHTYVEEEKVWKLFHHCALQISKVFHIMRLRRLRLEVLEVIRRAEGVVNDNHVYGSKDKKSRRQQSTHRSLCRFGSFALDGFKRMSERCD